MRGPSARLVAGSAISLVLIGGSAVALTRHEPRTAARSVRSVESRTVARSAVAARVARPRHLRGSRFFCKLAPGAASLPASRLRGLAHHLQQYPDLALATPAQSAAAVRLLATLRASARDWSSLGAASTAGFDLHTARRAAGDETPHYLHAESRRFANDGRYLDPQRPEALIYANVPGRPLVLIGAMFSMPRGIQGPNPAGPIARWHFHRVCARGTARGLKPLADGTCPPGESLGEGSEMLHVWFTHELRSAYAIHAPEPEL